MTRFIAFVSGKGGVGKTTSTINVGQALINLGHKVVLLDANLVTPNLGIYLGLMDPPNSLNKFLRKEKSLKQITYLHESGLSFIPASPSYTEFQRTNPQKLGEIFEHLEDMAEFVLVDSPSGLGFDVQQVLKNCDEALVVVTPTLSSVMDALKSIELAKSTNTIIAGILLNMTHWGRNELTQPQVEEIMGYPVIANIKAHRKVWKTAHKQLPLNYLYSHSTIARQFRKVAEHLCLTP